jgi:hypothetical protein
VKSAGTEVPVAVLLRVWSSAELAALLRSERQHEVTNDFCQIK